MILSKASFFSYIPLFTPSNNVVVLLSSTNRYGISKVDDLDQIVTFFQ